MNPVRIAADDFGLDPSVNQGIRELAEGGHVDAVSIMAHEGACLEDLDGLAGTRASLGAHVVLVEERPLGGEAGLEPILQAGRFPKSYKSLFAGVVLRPSLLPALAREARCQILRLVEAGLDLQFANSHQHVHLFPPLWKVLGPVFAEFGLEVRASRGFRLRPDRQGMLDLASSLALWRHPVPDLAVVRPIGVNAAGRMTPEAASRAARAASAALGRGERAELVTHPGHESERLWSRYGHWDYRWQTEYQHLAAGAIRRALDEAVSAWT